MLIYFCWENRRDDWHKNCKYCINVSSSHGSMLVLPGFSVVTGKLHSGLGKRSGVSHWTVDGGCILLEKILLVMTRACSKCVQSSP